MDISDKRLSISEVQRFLLTVSYGEGYFNPITVDGIYASETTEAVRKFQEHNGLPITGEVDFTTYTALYENVCIIDEKNASSPA